MPQRSFLLSRLTATLPAVAFCLAVAVPTHGSAEAPTGVRSGSEATADVWTSAVRPRFRLRPDFELATDVVIGFSDAFPDEATALASAIAPSAHVVVLLAEDTEEKEATRWFSRLPPEVQRRTTVLTSSAVDSLWVRDYGPFVATAGASTRWLDAGYLLERPLDDQFPLWLGAWLEIEPLETNMVADGGAVISDGQGHCISTRDYWLEDGLVDEDDPQLALHELGCEDMLLVPSLRLDYTQHVDMFAQFVSAERVLVGEVDPDEDAEDAERMDEAAEAIAAWAKAGGRKLEIVRVPIPVLDAGSYYTYINLLQLEDRVVVPHYPQISRGREAAILATLESALQRKLVKVDMGEFRGLGGVIHCATLNLRLPQGAPWRE